jgi:outer membrane protein assembly factor BamB
LASSVGVSPDGTMVFVTGSSLNGVTPGVDYATLAYDASTGAKLWTKRYDGPGNGDDNAYSLGVSPDGTKVFVTGESFIGSTTGFDYLTIAYSASKGTQRWKQHFSGQGNGYDTAYDLDVSPSGGRVFVTGYIQTDQSIGIGDYGTVAYDAATGAKLWAKRYGGPNDADDYPKAVAAGPGGKVFVTGSSADPVSGDTRYATVAYGASTGTRLWAKQYNGGTSEVAAIGAHDVIASPDGNKVFVTGTTAGSTTTSADGTLAYDVSTGAKLWARRYGDPLSDQESASSIAVSPDGTEVFVTGSATIAYVT